MTCVKSIANSVVGSGAQDALAAGGRRRVRNAALCVTAGVPLLFALLAAPPVLAEESASAKSIIDRIENLYRGNASGTRFAMTIVTPRYERKLEMTSVSMGTEHVLIRILSPKKDRGVSTLKQDEEMWNFFPKVNQVFKVPPSMMMSSWMGSDFTNDDLVRDTPLTEAYDLELQDRESSYLITLTPRESTVTVWGKIEYVVDRDSVLPVTQTYFDDRGNKIRVMSFSEITKFGEHTVPAVIELNPVGKPDHKTTIRFQELALDPEDVDENLFSLRDLKKRF